MEEYITYEVTFIETKEKWIFQYRKSDKILHCFINLKGSSFINLLRKQTFPENVEMIDRFMLGDTGMGVLKLLTCGGFGIWTIVDWFSIMAMTREKNLETFLNSFY